MLVITRKRDEAIIIGDGIEIRVLRVGRDGVRLGVSAPGDVAVHRREIYEQVREENRVAAATGPSVLAAARQLSGLGAGESHLHRRTCPGGVDAPGSTHQRVERAPARAQSAS